MALIGTVTFGFVSGWASCFAAGWHLSVLIVRLLWIAALVGLVTLTKLPDIEILSLAALAGGVAHSTIAYAVEINRASAPKVSA